MKRLFLLYVIVVVFAFKCEKSLDHTSSVLTVKNNSNDTLIFLLSFDYPSIILPDWQKSMDFSLNIPANKEGSRGLSHGTFSDIIRQNNKDTLVAFFVSIDTLRKYGDNSEGYATMRKNNNYLGYRFFTIKDIDSAGNGYVAYP